MGDHGDALAVFMAGSAQQTQDELGSIAVEVAGRFIGKDDLWPGSQSSGNGDSLLLAAGQLTGPVVEPVGQAHRLDDIVQPGCIALLACKIERQPNVLDCGQSRNQVEGLKA